MRFRCVPERDDQRMAVERLLDDPTLDALAASVDEPDFAKSGLVRRVDVFLDNGRDVARSKGVQVELVFDRDAVIIHR